MAPGPTPLVPKPQALRYRRGKLPNGAPIPDSDESSSEEDDDNDNNVELNDKRARGRGRKDDTRGDASKAGLVAGGAGRVIPQPKIIPKNIQVALRDVEVQDDGAVLIGGKREISRVEGDDEDEDEGSTSEEESDAPPTARPTFRKPGSAPVPLQGANSGEESEYETDSGEEEDSDDEEEEEKPKVMIRPTFVPKRARETVTAREIQELKEAEEIKRKEAEFEQRQKESRDLLGETIKREMAAKETTENAPDVDDTDDLDPAAEFDAWRLRELSRLARDKEASLVKESERAEIERRRALPEAQRLREDEEYARRTRELKMEEREERGFMDKFYHKGAFHQDDEILKRRVSGKTESAVDINLLPKIMQVKNFGKYTHLKDQDTTQEGWDRALRRGPGGPSGGAGGQSEGCFNCGGPHLKRDCPNNNPGGEQRTGANASGVGFGGSSRSTATGEARDGGYGDRAPLPPPRSDYRDREDGRGRYDDERRDNDGRSRGDERRDGRYDDRDRDRDRYRDRDDGNRRGAGRDRSRSPPRYRDDQRDRRR